MIYRLLPFLLTFIAGRLKKSQKAKRAAQNQSKRATPSQTRRTTRTRR